MSFTKSKQKPLFEHVHRETGTKWTPLPPPSPRHQFPANKDKEEDDSDQRLKLVTDQTHPPTEDSLDFKF